MKRPFFVFNPHSPLAYGFLFFSAPVNETANRLSVVGPDLPPPPSDLPDYPPEKGRDFQLTVTLFSALPFESHPWLTASSLLISRLVTPSPEVRGLGGSVDLPPHNSDSKICLEVSLLVFSALLFFFLSLWLTPEFSTRQIVWGTRKRAVFSCPLFVSMLSLFGGAI